MMLTCPIPPAAPATTVDFFVSKLPRGECECVRWEPRTCFDHVDGVVCVDWVSGCRKKVVQVRCE